MFIQFASKKEHARTFGQIAPSGIIIMIMIMYSQGIGGVKAAYDAYIAARDSGASVLQDLLH